MNNVSVLFTALSLLMASGSIMMANADILKIPRPAVAGPEFICQGRLLHDG
jgi:hypothetical protein